VTRPHYPILLGTTGWSYPDWIGAFYPEGTAQRDFLRHYAKRFAAVEVDSTYYATPARSTVQAWADATPPGFRFCLKVPGTITHQKALKDCDEEIDRLLAVVRPLEDKLFCLVLQFGYFNRKAFAKPQAFFDRLVPVLTRLRSHHRLAVEIRNRTWLGDDYFALLRACDAAAVLADHAWMPPIAETARRFDVVTTDFAYLRLIGDRRQIEEITDHWDRIVIDRSERMRPTARVIRQLSERTQVLTFLNNHFAGHAPESARLMRGMIDEEET
jgi:uncharacterized protein YecE (DUF72 family)